MRGRGGRSRRTDAGLGDNECGSYAPTLTWDERRARRSPLPPLIHALGEFFSQNDLGRFAWQQQDSTVHVATSAVEVLR